MDSKASTEGLLRAGIPEKVLARIEELAGGIDPSILKDILESEEMERFAKSLELPKVVKQSNTSVLLKDIKKKLTIGREKPAKSGAKAAPKER